MTSETEIDKKYFLNKVRDNPAVLDVGCYDGSDSREFADLFKSSMGNFGNVLLKNNRL